MTELEEGRASRPAFGPPPGLACCCWHTRHAGACPVPACPCPAFRPDPGALLLAVLHRLRRLLP